MTARAHVTRGSGIGSGKDAFRGKDVVTDSLLRPAAAKHMRDNGIDAWFTFHNPPHILNPAALRLLRATGVQNLTAMVLAVIYPDKPPILICSKLERKHYDYFEPLGEVIAISTKDERDDAIRRATEGCRRIAAEHTPGMFVGGTSILPAAMLDWLRIMSSAEIVSSGDLLQAQVCVLTEQELASHVRAAELLTRFVKEAFAFIGQEIRAGRKVTEYDVQHFLVTRFEQNNLECDHPPIVAVRENGADPHYAPIEGGERLKEIQKGDLVLIDIWAKDKDPNAIYADLGWMGFVGSKAEFPVEYAMAFSTLVRARDAALIKMQEMFARGDPLVPQLIDRAAREVIIAAGYPDYNMHSTGHSITTIVHGEGVSITGTSTSKGDDPRLVLPGTLSSDEPGIYIPGRYGMRIEADVYVDPVLGPRATCEIQREIVFIE
ncbi:aminopeptidase P family protein [Candidatus Micrarchaeota archaeon]|nr:aminopeptidase P family protein [Candidatus Micrarchaeota archaeon]